MPVEKTFDFAAVLLAVVAYLTKLPSSTSEDSESENCFSRRRSNNSVNMVDRLGK